MGDAGLPQNGLANGAFRRLRLGARPLKRVLQREVANKRAEEVLSGFIADGDRVVIDAADDGGGLTFELVPAGAAEEAEPAEA